MADDVLLLQRILRECRTVAIVGWSAEPHRPSHVVSLYLRQHGYRVLPVNPKYALDGPTVLGERCHARLEDIAEKVDMVDVFRKTEDVLPIAQSAMAIGARCLWQQIGVVNGQADRIAREAGLDSVMDRCVKIDHARFMRGAGAA